MSKYEQTLQQSILLIITSNSLISYITYALTLLVKVIGQANPAAQTASYAAKQQAAMASAMAQAAPYAAMGIPITIKPQTPPPDPEPPSLGTEPEPSSYNDLFTYSGYFDPYQDDVHAFMINGKRRRRHRVNCGRDRKGRYCDFKRSHHQHGLYNRDCIHYGGSLEIYGLWQCGSRTQLSSGAIIRFLVELHELVLDYKQQKNDYALQRFQRIMDYNSQVYAELKRIFKKNIKKNIELVMDILEKANQQVIENFQQILDMSNEILGNIKKDRESELDELKSQLQELLESFPPPSSICQQLSECELCLSREGCVWCTQEQNCQEGTARDGAFFNSCDIWVSGSECPEPSQLRFQKKVSVKGELDDYYNQQDLELDQKLYLASKQREMVQLKNQIENRRTIIDQMIQIERDLKRRSIQIIDEFTKNKEYDGEFLSQIADEDAEGKWDGYKKETKEIYKEDQDERKEKDAEEMEKKKIESDKQKEREEFEKKEYEKRNEATVINKSKYRDRESVKNVLEKEEKKEEKKQGT